MLKLMRSIFARLFVFLGLGCPLFAAERPNILWITSEDNSASWLGCYGSKEAVTPRLDALAAGGLRFTHAYSNAAVCAVARSTILNGVHAVAQGTQHMRSRHSIPADIKPCVSYLREQGYYCTNQSKTDYNFKGNDAVLWDACSAQAHYKKRPKDQPFFAVFNLAVSHESSLFPAKIAAHRKSGIIPPSPRLDPSQVALPAYLPDLPEIRSDIAIYHDTITALDSEVGRILDELKTAGLADDTIVFYYSDHGGTIPRGKRYLEDSGVRVPMLVHFPEKWRHLAPFAPGQAVDEIVSFVDLAPTLLSLTGVEKPAQMQGRPFLGSKRVTPRPDEVAFLYADRFDEIYGMRRAITDGRWKYIRCFTPWIPAAPCSEYCFDQAGWTAWRAAWQQGKLKPPFQEIWQAPQPVERLFDITADPMEIRNLAADPEHQARLAAMRGRLKSEMIRHGDTGIIPEPMFADLAANQPVADYLKTRKAELPALVSQAFEASAGNKNQLPQFIERLTSADPLHRLWAAQACLTLGKEAAPAADTLVKLLDDSHSAVRVAAGHALFGLGRYEEGKVAVLAELEKTHEEYAVLNTLNALTQMDALGGISDAWVERTLKAPKTGEYANRLANRLRNKPR